MSSLHFRRRIAECATMLFKAFAPEISEPLNVLYALERFVAKDAKAVAAVPVASVPFAKPSDAGTLYEADALTWRVYHAYPEAISHAINNQAYGADFAARLRCVLATDTSQPVSVSDAKARVLRLREQLFLMKSDNGVV